MDFCILVPSQDIDCHGKNVSEMIYSIRCRVGHKTALTQLYILESTL